MTFPIRRAIRPGSWQASKEEAARQRHERLIEQWKDIRRLYLAGADLRDICKRLGISPRTVYRYKDLAEPPHPAYKRRASVLDRYVPYLVRRWNEGCRNGKRLYREIREQGYAKATVARQFVGAQLRVQDLAAYLRGVGSHLLDVLSDCAIV